MRVYETKRHKIKLFIAVAILLSLAFTVRVVRAIEQSVDVILYYPKDGTQNPDGSDGTPNWFYYWKQTKANCGAPMVYSGACHLRDSSGNEVTIVCSPDVAGFWCATDEKVHICSSTSETDFITHYTGIDFFAITCLHEGTHLKNWQTWWENTNPNYIYFLGYKDFTDSDQDGIPDNFENSFTPKLEVGKKNTFSCCDKDLNPLDPSNCVSGDPNVFDCPWESDEHYLAYKAEKAWAKGNADCEDWADPGHQSNGIPSNCP